MENKIRLYGFNNLTKVLSFNIYDICYAKTARGQKDYVAYIDEQYNSERLTNILVNIIDEEGEYSYKSDGHDRCKNLKYCKTGL